MARFYALFAFVASACAIATPLRRDDTGLSGILQDAECSALTSGLLSGLQDAVGVLGLFPEASAIVTVLNEAISIGNDLTGQCNEGAAQSNSSSLVSSRDLFSGILDDIVCNSIFQDVVGAVEAGVGLLGGSSNAQISSLVGDVNTALSLIKGLTASCPSSSLSSTKRQLSIGSIGSIVDSLVCNSGVEEAVSIIQTALPILQILPIADLQVFVTGITTALQLYDSLESSCPAATSAATRDVAARDFFGSLGSIFQNAECSSVVGVLLGGLKTVTALLDADTNAATQPFIAALNEAVSLGQAATASCSS
jgi:hypothetical protein